MIRSCIKFVLFCLVLWLGPVCDGWADDGAGALRVAAAKLLADGSADDTVKAGVLLDEASQIEARSADVAKARAASAVVEQEIESGLAPLISMLVLAGTLVFNFWQWRVTARDKRADDARKDAQDREDRARQAALDGEKAFNDALNIMMSADKFSPAAAMFYSFMNGPYKERARAAGISLMRATRSIDTFRDLFRLILVPMTPETVEEALEMLRSAHAATEALYDQCWVEGVGADLSKLRPDQVRDYELQLAKRQFLSVQVANHLRVTPAGGTSLDLSRTGFDSCSLSGVNFGGVVLGPGRGVWRSVNLDDCDMRGVSGFEEFWTFNTAWWHAKAMDGALLDRLERECPYRESEPPVSPRVVTAQSYAADLARLRRGG